MRLLINDCRSAHFGWGRRDLKEQNRVSKGSLQIVCMMAAVTQTALLGWGVNIVY